MKFEEDLLREAIEAWKKGFERDFARSRGEQMKPLIIYHKRCMDGAGAALAAWLRFGDQAEYRPASRGDPAPTDEECTGRDVYILGFSYPRAELERLQSRYLSARILLLDHHKLAQVDLAGIPFCIFDMRKSGAVMAWELFHHSCFAAPPHLEGRVPELLRYIQDRDRWELPHSREISAALAVSGALEDFSKLIPIYDEWDFSAGDGHSRGTLVLQGEAILRAQAQMVARIVATAEEVEIPWSRPVPGDEGAGQLTRHLTSSMRCLAACSAVLQSEVGEALALESAQRGRQPVGVVYYRDGEAGKWRASLHSRELGTIFSPDVSVIAEAYGGGGHAGLAKFECEELPWSAS